MRHRSPWFLLPLLLWLVGCASDTTEIAICASLPLANGENPRAVSMSRAIEQAIVERNVEGGVRIGGERYLLRYVPMDDTSPATDSWDTAQEAANARAAIAEHDCVAYIGTYNSGAAKIAMPILNRVQMAMISPGNTYPGLTKPGTGVGDEPWIYSPLGPANRNYCRVVPSDDLQAPAAARYAATLEGVERIFIFHDTELYGRGLAEIFAEAALAEGLTVVADPLGVGARTMEPQTVAATILATEPDLVYFGGVTANGPARVLTALRAQGYQGYFMGADGIAESEFLQDAGVARNDQRVLATLVGQPIEALPEAGQAWASRYRARYNSAPDAFAAPSYEAALVLFEAIERAEASDPTDLEALRPAILRAMRATDSFEGILGPWSFDENCDTDDATISINRAEAAQFSVIDIVNVETTP